MNNIRFFEVCLSDDPNGNETDNDVFICIRAARTPTVDELHEFLAADEENFERRVVSFCEISREDAERWYDFEDGVEYPVFGI